MVPPGGFSKLMAELMSIGFQLRAPVNSACATPAAMNSEIPLPIPHFDTTSSIRNNTYDPNAICRMMSALAPPRPTAPWKDDEGTR